ncbi:hypothetical protein Sthe_1125 [Sphaerobacter thermophilus DSM 20745]|uniref:Uncharacterized protein n=1 Tax=Sphaerobacter thermophilus (strain ATCC 49802 / DSM 20745 / KCCM 41009 / NCIMB 13125 / S 6022) TaxID=479434 RepID=D1C2U4_SPHTD|nr:hypothetical protein Sthe_1125 [Sphaerobacter thermophilus DSM 20745]
MRPWSRRGGYDHADEVRARVDQRAQWDSGQATVPAEEEYAASARVSGVHRKFPAFRGRCV